MQKKPFLSHPKNPHCGGEDHAMMRRILVRQRADEREWLVLGHLNRFQRGVLPLVAHLVVSAEIRRRVELPMRIWRHVFCTLHACPESVPHARAALCQKVL